MQLDEPMPRLAQLVVASPLEAAIHDAYGKVLGQNSYNLLGSEFVNADLAHYLTDEFAGEYLDRYTLRTPKPRMPLYHLVGALDPLTDADIEQRVDDGLPETLGEWIQADGLTHLKIKLNGDDLDLGRRSRGGDRAGGGRSPGCTWLHHGTTRSTSTRNVPTSSTCSISWPSRRAIARGPASALQYIEQPTHRDLQAQLPRTGCTRRPRSSRW